MGDPSGIGPEITIKAWHALKTQSDYAFAVISTPDHFSNIPHVVINDLVEIGDSFSSGIPILPIDGHPATSGQPDEKHAPAILASIEKAVRLCQSGRASAMITNPIAKHILYDAGFKFPGHTELLGHLSDGHETPYAKGPVMMLAAKDLKVGLVSVHMPLKDVADYITVDMIVEKARTMLGALRLDFGISNPRLALTGLNPHAGEGGALGMEELNIINPAAKILRQDGHEVSDAQSADTLFHSEARQGYDAVLAMYHDQGLIPVKTLDFHGGVNITLGLPFIRTSPDHGTAFNIAGQNSARADSLIAAIKSARHMSGHRYGP